MLPAYVEDLGAMVRADVGADLSVRHHERRRYQGVVDRDREDDRGGPGRGPGRVGRAVAQCGAVPQDAQAVGPRCGIQVAHDEHGDVEARDHRGGVCELRVAISWIMLSQRWRRMDAQDRELAARVRRRARI